MYNPQLETFLCVVEAGSFNKAAERLYISPPAVIKQINLLEENLDLQLFIRTHRGLILTEAGKSLEQDAKYIIQYCKDSVTRARNAMQESVDVIRIGTSPMTPAQVLVDLWPKLQEYCPNTKFQLIPFDNTPENAREILGNLGQNIDVVAGIFDETMLNLRRCAGLELSREPICCAVSIHHRLAQKERLTVEDLYGENLMLMRREWSHYVDLLRDDIWKNHPQIHIVDFDFYDVAAFNQCENNNCVLMAVENWRYVHPLLKILRVDWDYTIPFGLLHAPAPSPVVERFLQAVKQAVQDKHTQKKL
ncbi:MAG TPA: LysR family transcriptional regulator [Firmicutes bacterium]|nr:LysR family transcriptional regulator [Bacillota bacterium]